MGLPGESSEISSGGDLFSADIARCIASDRGQLLASRDYSQVEQGAASENTWSLGFRIERDSLTDNVVFTCRALRSFEIG